MPLGDFAVQAATYAARPGYPGALVDRLVARAGVHAGDPVADVGAGTGLFTVELASRGLAVRALEPSREMRARAPAMAGVVWSDGTFEATGLADGSMRWVTAAQAFHWADPPRALPELHRVLADGGALTVLWNDRRDDDSPIVAATRDLIRSRLPDFDEAYRRRDWGAILTSTGHFRDPVADEDHHVVVMPRDRYLALWRSHNRLAETAGPARLPALLADIDALVGGVEVVEVPYATQAWTAWKVARRAGEAA